ncbi:ribosome silencing factor [Lysobacter sp. TY2-98]|nr:ribosome silencing factor [Lysobacter sp. TY2-98]
MSTEAHVIKTRLPSPPPSVDDLLKTVRDAVEELKARDVVEIDVRGKSSVTDFMVIASGTSTRHVKSIADEVVKFSKQRLDVMPLGVEGEREAEWVLVDLGDVIVHVMLPRVREFYALERLWTVGDEPPERVDELAHGHLSADLNPDEEPLSFEDDADEFDVERRPRPAL